MAKDDEPIDDLQPVALTRVTKVPAETPVSRLDFGDAVQRAEMEGVAETPLEPVEMVDAPVQIRKPFTPFEKRRNQRRLPT
ncbi:hypothetical protein [Plantactinospora sp. CA-290183]|uniref:hypothetical protein n=1 Tax=Plantactinospora sp. CA-290183 TaxID=3240006 RepID=UPI003D946433